MSSNYPPGTGPSDPNAPWNESENEECVCGHAFDEHDGGGGECLIEDCSCAAYEDAGPPEPDYDSMPGGADYEPLPREESP